MKTIVIIGGGAGGFFGAIASAKANPSAKVILLEKSRQLLAKVRISGGGRCNVTHACFDPAVLVQNYPRGNKALLGPFHRFQPKDTIAWFEKRGVELKKEGDGRMFPATDSSETIISCLVKEAIDTGVEIRTECGVESIERQEGSPGFWLNLSKGGKLNCDKLLLATGSHFKAYEWVKSFGHTINEAVPSLFTFNIPDSPFTDLSGISVPSAHLKIHGTSLEQTGPLLITHWGFSGPAVLKLSAWGARVLHGCDYKAKVVVNWLSECSKDEIYQAFISAKSTFGARLVINESPLALPKNLWRKFVQMSGIPSETRWAVLSKGQIDKCVLMIHAGVFDIRGKSTHKEEFVTCGGIALEEVNFKTMESRICPGLHFAGEVLDIDGVTGGFNFQSAWTTSWIAGQAM